MSWNFCGDGCRHGHSGHERHHRGHEGHHRGHEGHHGGHERDHKENEIRVVINENPIVNFLRTLSPGIQVELQYDCQPPACGTFQGFENGNVLLSNYNDFPGLVRIAPNRINAVAPIGHGCKKRY